MSGPLYILVVCAGSLCMPVDNVGAYTLTQAECEARMMQVPGGDVHCSDASGSARRSVSRAHAAKGMNPHPRALAQLVTVRFDVRFARRVIACAALD